MSEHQILKVLVGSRAHGLHTEASDYDYRGVFVVPLKEVFKVGEKIHDTNWIEGDEDNTSWEIGHFLKMATQCNPTILEVFAAPMITETEWGNKLCALFPYVWDPKRVFDAFTGYGVNQRKKMLEDKDKRAAKYAVAYLRTLIQASELLATGVLRVNFSDHPMFNTLRDWKNSHFTPGGVIDVCNQWENEARLQLELCTQKQDLEKINEFYYDVRMAHQS